MVHVSCPITYPACSSSLTVLVVSSFLLAVHLFNVIVVTAAGAEELISSHPTLLDQAAVDDPEEPLCRKNIGIGKRLRKWSRGHQFVVRGGGIIDTWQPLYRYVVHGTCWVRVRVGIFSLACYTQSSASRIAYNITHALLGLAEVAVVCRCLAT